MKTFPPFGFIEQVFETGSSQDPATAVASEFFRTGLLSRIRPGERVAVTAGSRGIDQMPAILKACVAEIKKTGANPFLLPAMGSHGSGMADAQVGVLEHLGINEALMGCPVHGHMEMIELGTVDLGVPVLAEKAALEADHVLVVNRVKEHTEYIGTTESGILKMMVVGLGRHKGAEAMHRLAVNISYEKAIHRIAQVLLDRLSILGAVAVLEDQNSCFRRLEAVPADAIFSREPDLLQESKAFKASLPFETLDILIVDQIGKNISGTGVDTKVVGRIMNIYEKECDTPKITRLVIRDLTEATGGNATGIGLADYITQRAFSKIDLKALAVNCITAIAPEKGRIPLTLDSDREALAAAYASIGIWTPDTVRVAWIKNSAEMKWLAVSPALLKEAAGMDRIKVASADTFDIPFDSQGNMPFLQELLAF